MNPTKKKKGVQAPKQAAPIFFEPQGGGKSKNQAFNSTQNSALFDSFVGQELELAVESMAPSGQALCKYEGKTIFLDLGMPGQKVLAKITGFARGVYTAQRLKVLQAAQGQVEAFCPYFADCGGCAWQEIGYEEQLKLKSQSVQETLQRLGGVENLDLHPIIPSPKTKAFRGKMEFAFANAVSAGKKQKNSVLLGLRQRLSHQVVPISLCPVSSPNIGALLEEVRLWVEQNSLSAWQNEAELKENAPIKKALGQKSFEKSGVLRFLNMRVSSLNDEMAVELITAPAPFAAKRIEELGNKLLTLPFVQSFTHSIRQSEESVAIGEQEMFTQGQPMLKEKLGELEFELSPGSFFQTNIAVATLLQQKILELAEMALPGNHESEVWDVYSGVGAIALALAKRYQKVLGLEISKTAVENAKINAKLNNLTNCSFVAGDVSKSLRASEGAPKLVVLDPPRAGLSSEVLKTLLFKKIPHLIYVSCNPSTLARDLGLLREKYKLEYIQALDMFPHTAHVEVICLLSRQ